MRVAMVIQSYLPVLGGAQRQVQRLGPLLDERGVETVVVTRHPPGTPLRERQPGIDVHRISGPVAGPLASINYTLRGATTVARLRPDVVHVHDLLSPSTAALLARELSGVPVVAKVLAAGPGGDVARLMTKPAGRRRLALMSRRFAAFICLSSDVEEELVAQGVPRERLRTIPNGVDTSHFRPPASDDERRGLRGRLGIPDDAEPLALYCGRFADVKRIDVLLEALCDAPGRLLLVGEGHDEPRLRQLATDLGLEGRVVWHDKVDDTAPYHRAADAYVSASSSEGMSGSVLEAMATGLPVIAAPASGMSELLGDGAGVVLASDGPGAVAAALRELADDRDARAATGTRAREVVSERFALSRTADLLVDLYREVRGR